MIRRSHQSETDRPRPRSFPRQTSRFTGAPRIGSTVVTLSGKPLGTVSAVEDWRFRMTAGPVVMWIRSEAIYLIEDRQLMLICEENGVSRYHAELPCPHDSPPGTPRSRCRGRIAA